MNLLYRSLATVMLTLPLLACRYSIAPISSLNTDSEPIPIATKERQENVQTDVMEEVVQQVQAAPTDNNTQETGGELSQVAIPEPETIPANDPLPAQAPLPIRTTFDPTYGRLTSQNFVVWWGPEAEAEVIEGAELLLADLQYAWDVGVGDMGMPGPLGRNAFLINIYISFTGGEFEDWGPGVGTDEEDYPFMILPAEMVEDYLYNQPNTDESLSDFTYHEVFHLFQYAPDERVRDHEYSYWIIEAAANWFAIYMNPNDEFTYHIVHAIGLNPQLPLWADDWNQPNEPESLSHARLNHHYASFHFLEYLEERYGYEAVIAPWVNPRPERLPQEILREEVAARGGSFQADFSDYAARNATWDHPHGELIEEWVDIGATEDWLSPGDDNRYIDVYGPEGTQGWQAPPDELAPAGYGYNVIRLDIEETAASYTFAFAGNPTGNEGTQSVFGVTVVELIDDERIYTSLALDQNLQGEVTLELEEFSTNFLVVAATPHRLESNETYAYQYMIEPR